MMIRATIRMTIANRMAMPLLLVLLGLSLLDNGGSNGGGGGDAGNAGARVLVKASRHLFSVHDDLLAFPQFEVLFPRSFVSEEDAAERLLGRGIGDDDGGPEVVQHDEEMQSEYKRMVHQGRHFLCQIPVVPSKIDDTAAGLRDGGSNGDDGVAEMGDAARVDDDSGGAAPVIDGNDDDSSDAMALQAARAAEEEEQEQEQQKQRNELARAAHRGPMLLRDMLGTCMYIRDGWWTYSFCYGDRVRQYHQLAPSQNVPVYPPQVDPTVPAFDLGVYSNKKKGSKDDGNELDHDNSGIEERGQGQHKAERGDGFRLETQGDTRYLVQTLTGGTVCDLTGRNRKVEIQFHCRHQSGDQIGVVREVSTCSYLMLIYTPRLCSDVVFQPPQESEPHAIMCEEIVAESVLKSINDGISAAESSDTTVISGQIAGEDANTNEKVGNEDFAEARHDSAILADLSIPFPPDPHSGFAAGREDESSENPAKPPVIVIGGTTVGAKKLVGGSEGRTISKSVIVGGGEETYVDTIASSDGRMLSVAEMKKLRVLNVRDVDKIKRDLAKVAGGKGWKLDVVDTPRGREFRGVVETDGKGAEGEEEDEEDVNEEQGSSESNVKKGNGRKGDGKKKDDGEPKQEGTEEVYKDEL